MFSSIWEDIKREYNYGNMVTRIIIVNVGVFIFVNLLWVFLRIFSGWETPGFYTAFLQFFEISSDWFHNLTHPWVVITHMFLHEGFWHILWNMLFMYWFGRIVGDFIGNQRVLPLYLLGGLVGGFVYFLSVNLLPYGGGGVSYALGASAAVNAFVVAAAVISPDYEMRLLLLGNIKLKYIAAALILLDLIGMAGNINTGGHFAHLGGAAFGWIFVQQLRRGTDWSIPVNQALDTLNHLYKELTAKLKGKSRPRPRVVYRNTEKERSSFKRGNRRSDDYDMSYQERLDAILDKIKQSGYDSLTQEEKEFLFQCQ